MSVTDAVMPVGIDTDLLIQSYLSASDLDAYTDPEARDSQRLFALYAKRLIEDIRVRKTPLLISSITVAEYLVKIPAPQHGQSIRELQELFTIVNFNLRSASIAADLVAKAKTRHKSARRNNDRMIVSADTKIIASLIAAGAKTIYFHDKIAYDLACHVVRDRVNVKRLEAAPSDLLDIIEDADTRDSL